MKLTADGEALKIWRAERKRQLEAIDLIPSENYASQPVLEALGSIFTNKYSEGYPGHRYYGGNFNIDEAEKLAASRSCRLFKTDYHVNVQPYSGSPANTAVMLGLLNFGDKVMGMALDQGGHLTHGHPVSFSGQAYRFTHYGVNKKTERLDYDEIAKLAAKVKPKMIICGATAYPREIDFKKFAKIAKGIGAILMADISHIAGLVAAGVHPSPFGYADVVTTTTHKTLRGPRGAVIFCKQKYARDIDRAVFPGLQGGPHDNVTLAQAVAFGEALQPSFNKYARQIVKNAQALAEELARGGPARNATHSVAGGLRLISGGTDNHLLLADVTAIKISGKTAQNWLEAANLVVNKNTIPYDKRTPADPSGIRLGAPACTTRGMREKEMKKIAGFILRVLHSGGNSAELKKIQKEVIQFSKKFKVPGIKNA